jgi:hypothetical protein
MSQVKISGNASGTGVLTIAAPNTNTDRSITIPDKAGAIAVGAGTIVQVVSSYGSAVDTTTTLALMVLLLIQQQQVPLFLCILKLLHQHLHQIKF